MPRDAERFKKLAQRTKREPGIVRESHHGQSLFLIYQPISSFVIGSAVRSLDAGTVLLCHFFEDRGGHHLKEVASPNST